MKINKKNLKEMSTLLIQYSLNNATDGAKKLMFSNSIEVSPMCIISTNDEDIKLKLNSTLIVDQAIEIDNELVCLYDLFDNKNQLKRKLQTMSKIEVSTLMKILKNENKKEFLNLLIEHSN